VSGEDTVRRLQEITDRLEEIRTELGGDADEERAGQLTQEAADLAAESVELVNLRLREGLAGDNGADDAA
jgi:hypothetical protein